MILASGARGPGFNSQNSPLLNAVHPRAAALGKQARARQTKRERTYNI